MVLSNGHVRLMWGPIIKETSDDAGRPRCGTVSFGSKLRKKQLIVSPTRKRDTSWDDVRGYSEDMCQVHSCQQKSIGLKFSKSQTGSDVRYSCHHNSSRFTFPIFALSCRFSVLHSLQSITPRIY